MSTSTALFPQPCPNLGSKPTLNGPMFTLRDDEGSLGEQGELMRLRLATRLYLNARRAELAPTTRRHHAQVLAQAARVIGPDLLVRSLKRKHIEDWLAQMTCAPSTIRTELSVMRTFCHWCIAHQHLKTDPTLGVKGPRARIGMPRELEAAAVTKTLLAAPDARATLAVLLGVQEGLRVSEIVGLERGNVDLGRRLMLVDGKGNKQRWLPISAETAQALTVYYREVPGASGPVLRSECHPNRGIGPKHLSRLMSQWMYDAGIKAHPFDGVSGHAARHTMAGAMLDDGADVRDVQAALGHANLGATWVYLRRRQADGQLRKSMGQRHYQPGA